MENRRNYISLLCFLPLLFLVLILFLPISEGFIPDRNSGYEPGLVTVSLPELEKTVEPGKEAVFKAVLINENSFPVFIHIEVLPLKKGWNTDVSKNDFFLEANSRETVLITLRAPIDAENGTTASALVLVNAGKEPDKSESANERIINAVVFVSKRSGFISAAMATSTSLILLSILAYLASTDAGKYSTSFFAAPLYSRIHRNKILEHETREEIYNYIKMNPGVNFTRIKEEFNLTNGTLLHHLRTLHRERFIKSCRTGLYRRFYPWGMKIEMAKTLTGQQKVIFKLIRKYEGISQTDIARELNTTRQSVNHHIKALEEMNLIRLKKMGRKTGCFLAEQSC